MLSKCRLASRSTIPSALIFGLIAVSILHVASAQDCDGACHNLATCDFNTNNESVCSCMPGTIDTSGGAGTGCDGNAWNIRYVVETDPGANPSAGLADADGLALCVNAAGWYVEKIWAFKEVNCLYPSQSRPTMLDVAAYGETTPNDSNVPYYTMPAVYLWTLATTSAAQRIPPTGMEVQSVEFNASCAETGCWVIKGLVTTGAAFNTNGAFNTFFLPQADITALHPQGDLSYDFDYSDVEWTFAPANHPCTSVAFEAGAAGASGSTTRVSTCCISSPNVSTTANGNGGFVANYRPTQAFSEWAGELPCDYPFERDGKTLCWKMYNLKVTRDKAREKCSAASGKLAVIASQEEHDAMSDMLGDLSLGPKYNHVWIGLKYSGEGGRVDNNWHPDFWDPTNYAWDEPEDENITFGIPNMFASGYNWPHGIYFDAFDDDWKFLRSADQLKFVCEFSTPRFETPCIKHVVQRPDLSAPENARPCWNVNEKKQSWTKSETDCSTAGGVLAFPEDAEENWFLHRLTWSKGHLRTWIGVSSPDGRPENYTVSDGTPLDYSPDTLKDTSPNKACVTTGGQYGPTAQWQIVGCGQPFASVCEMPRTDDTMVCDSDLLEDLDPVWDLPFPTNAGSFMEGKFKEMDASPGVVAFENLDPFFGQYSFEIHLDEVELRSKAGQLKGTVGVEHTVDTFLGLANFRPTGLPVLDTFATQVNIHLEKTSFFSVSTHGVNEYTFLEYINMRLISIYNQDIDFSGLDEAANRTIRTDSSGNANYVQVTFTMGQQYAPNPDSGGLIPLDSVRAGRGTFFDLTTLEHLCVMYDEGNATAGDKIGLTGLAAEAEITIFDAMLDQDCGPRSSMCVSPTSVPDQFVSFNIPLGFEVFDNQASSTLENNIFVSMVINALDKGPNAGANPNQGQNPMQMKTTLDASIPIVAGGINIFCDGITAKTDLKDVANADIIVGSAANATELTRLRIIEDVANTNLGATPSAEVDSDSIEAGLMTLVLKGNSSYFENGAVNTQGYSLELDDLITIHLMTDGEAPAETEAQCAAASAPKSVDCQVRDLLSQAPADNLDSNGLDTDGYTLNGAFEFAVDRGQGIAKLEPTAGLLSICPFNPTRPTGGLPLESCITRRDVRSRTYPVRSGAAGPTAMELLAQTDDLVSDSLANEMTRLEAQRSSTCTCSEGDDEDHNAAVDECCEAGFMQMILGENDYARGLAVDYVKAIHERYTLNGRYMRAYWINPGYEWTPTQTAGKSLFSVSQKVYLFALITLDENISRRRMLLATDVNPTKDSGSGVGGGQVSFPVARTSIMAQAFDVPLEKAVLFNVEMQLTQAEACRSDEEFVSGARATFVDYLDSSASSFHSVQVLGFTRALNGVECRRALRKLLADYSAATASVQMMIVYKDEGEAVFNDAAFAGMAGIISVAADPSTAANVVVDATYNNPTPNSETRSESSSSSSNTALIAGIAGGVGGGALLLAGAVLFARRRSKQATAVAEPVQIINVADLKAQLAGEV